MNRHHLALSALCFVALMGGGFASSTRAQVTGLTINSITNDPAGPVTAGQTLAYIFRMSVTNNSALLPATISLNKSSTDLTFGGITDPPGWQYTIDPALEGGGTSIPRGEVRNVIFRVTRTGTTTGVITLGGKVGGSLGNGTTTNGGSITVQSPPVLSYVDNSLGPLTVNRGQTVSFVVDVRNTGQATAVLVPSQTSISFDNFSALLSNPVSILGGATATLSFVPTVVGPSVPLGLHQLSISARYTHNGNPAVSANFNTGNDQVSVQLNTGGASIQIVSITAPPTATANQTTPYTIQMRVLNGPVPVRVSLDPDSTDLVFPPGGGWQYQIQSIQGGDNRLIANEQTDVIFTVTRTGTTTGVTQISGKVGASAGATRVTDTIDNGGSIQVQSLPSLSYVVNSLEPQTVNRDEQVSFVIEVTNPAGAATAELVPGQTTISFSTYTATLNPGSETSLEGGRTTSILFNPQVVGASIPFASYPVSVSARYTHNGNPATTIPLNAGTVTVEMGGGGTSQFHIQSTVSDALNRPGGVSYVNTNQMYNISVAVQNDGPALEDVVVSLHAAPAATIVPPADIVRDIGAQSSATWVFSVRAPATATQIQTFTASIDTAAYSGGQGVQAAPPVDDTEFAVVQTPAELDLSFEITSPFSARDGTMSIGQVFDVTAVVTNSGEAEIDPASQAAVTLTLPPGFSLTSGQLTQDFTIDVPVGWSVRAPNTPTASSLELATNITAIPDDINTKTTALVQTGRAAVTVNVVSVELGLDDASAVQGIVGRSVPGGTKDIDLYALDLTYLAGEGEESDARVDTIFVSVVGGNGQRINNPGRTVGRLYAWLNGATTTAPVLSANPVMIPVSALGPSAMIGPNQSATLILGVDVLSSPASSEIRLSVARGGDLIARNVSSAQVLGVVDRITEEPIDGNYLSPPLTILSNQFEEYAHNAPNPFAAGSRTTQIAYFLDGNTDVSIEIYAITGDLVYKRSLAAGSSGATAGPQEVEWDGRNMRGDVVRNGVYVCVLQAGSQKATIRIAVAK